jgi:hypothetical protein
MYFCNILHRYIKIDVDGLFEQQTTIAPKTLNPEWNEVFYFTLDSDQVVSLFFTVRTFCPHFTSFASATKGSIKCPLISTAGMQTEAAIPSLVLHPPNKVADPCATVKYLKMFFGISETTATFPFNCNFIPRGRTSMRPKLP